MKTTEKLQLNVNLSINQAKVFLALIASEKTKALRMIHKEENIVLLTDAYNELNKSLTNAILERNYQENQNK